MSKLVTVKQCAEILGITTGAVYDLVAARKIGHFRIGTGRGSIRFRREDVEDYLSDCFRPPHSDAPPERKPARRSKSPSLAGLKYVGDCL